MGWIGNIFLIIGVFFINQKTRWPFLFMAVGEAIWFAYSMNMHKADMAFICFLFCILATRNFFKWRVSNELD